MFEMMSLCYLADCTPPEDMSSNSLQFVLLNGSNFMLDILFWVPQVNAGYSRKFYFSVYPINKNHRDLNLVIVLAIIHDLSPCHQTHSGSHWLMGNESCSIIQHEITVQLFILTQLIKKWMKYERCIPCPLTVFLKKMDPISLRPLIEHHIPIFMSCSGCSWKWRGLSLS